MATSPAKEASVMVGSSSISLDQLNKEVLIARDRYAKAGSAERETLGQTLRQLITQRAVILAATLPVDPGIILQTALPAGTADTLPAGLGDMVERPATLEGVIESARGTPITASFPYELRDRQGRRWRLAPAGATPVVTAGASVKLTGIRLQDVLAFNSEELRSVSRSGLDSEPPRVVIDTPGHGAVIRGAVAVRITASDNQRLRQVQLRKNGVPAGTDADAPYEFFWDTAKDADGPHSLVAHAHDADMNLGSSAPITVTVDNTAPRVELRSPEPGMPLSGVVPLQAQAHDAVGLEAVKFLVDGLAVGIAVHPPYHVDWDSAAVANGPHTIEALALDRAQNAAKTAQVPVRVINANHAPELIPTGAKAVQEGVTLAFTVKALDKDGTKDPLIYHMTNTPPWARFDESTGQFYGTPDFTEASGAHPTTVYENIRIDACDAQPLCDREDIAISVINVNRPPVMEPLRVPAVAEGTPLTLKPFAADPDGEGLECRISNLPPWMRFEAGSCTAQGTPGFELVSQQESRRTYADVRVEVCDPNRACAQQSLTLSVLNENRKPVLTRIGDHAVDELKSLMVRVHAEDPDKESVSLIAAPLPEGAKFTAHNSGSGVLTWTPRADQAGSYALTVQAADHSSRDLETIQIRVRETHVAISGIIRTDIGTRLAGAAVELSRGNARAALVRTDEQGMYLAMDLPPGIYEIRPSAKVSNLPTYQAIHFSPLSRRVELTDRDQREMDFTSHFKTR